MIICCYRLLARLMVKALPFCAVLLVGNYTMAQDPVFSQFYAAPLELNPAFTGGTEGGKIGLNYRNQWPRLNQAYVTYSASYDQFFPFISSGFGISVLADNAGRGLYKTTDVSLYYAYVLRVDQTLQIRFGLEAGMINSRVDWSRLIFLDQIDPEFGPISPGGLPYPSEEVPPETGTSLSVFDISMGLLVFNETFYGGLALKHMNAPEFSFLKINTDLTGTGLPMRVSAHGGAEFDVLSLGRRGSVFVAPGIQYITQGDFSQLNIGTIFRYDKVGTGVWYRHTSTNPDALIFMLEGRQDQFRVAYSYDMTLSGLGDTGGAHEVSFIVNFDYGSSESKYNDCFNLFR